MNIPEAMRKPLAVMFVVFMGLLGIQSWGFSRADAGLQEAIHNSCVSRNVNASNTNLLLNQLIANAEKSVTFKAEEKVERMAGWAALRHQLEECGS